MTRRTRRARGFTLIEAMVSMVVLILVMTVTMSLLFGMRSFAERQQLYTAPRQTARRAVDYIGQYVQAACDLNPLKNDPLAVLTAVNWGTALVQTAYNNLTGTEMDLTRTVSINAAVGGSGKYTKLGDVGTDIVTLAIPVGVSKIPVADWPGIALGRGGARGEGFAAANGWIDFEEGCDGTASQNDNNMAVFKAMTGYDAATDMSAVIGVTDINGIFRLIQITGYQQSVCENGTAFWDGKGKEPDCISNDPLRPCPIIHIVANPSSDVNPPGGRIDMRRPVALGVGIRFISFRVRTPTDANGNPTGPPNLEQKLDIFNPFTDNPGTSFVPVMENVEDFQVAYLYQDPPVVSGSNTIYNTGDASGEIPDTLANPDPLIGTPIYTSGVGAGHGVPPFSGQASFIDGATTLCNDYPFVPVTTPLGCRYDARYVRGLRITITARSQKASLIAGEKRVGGTGATVSPGQKSPLTMVRPEFNYRPDAEDHKYTSGQFSALAPDGYEHNKMTTTLLIRNRMLGY